MADKKKPADPLAGLDLTPPPMAPSGSARQPLGPPLGYYTEGAAIDPARAGFKPYITGDEWVPATYETADRDRLKSRMNAAGLYGTAGYQSGSWTQSDANAYEEVLKASNATFTRDENVVIDNIAAEVKKGPRAMGPRAPLVSRISNPDDIRAVIRDSAYSLTGSRLSDEDEQRLISMYQGQQGAADQAAYGAAGGAGGTVTEAASQQNFAAAQIERLRPGAVATHRHLEAFEKILGSMGTMVPETPTYAGGGLPKAGGEVL
jgi:hypothetical protein